MKYFFIFVLVAGLVFIGYWFFKPVQEQRSPSFSKENIGKQITVEGWAVDAKVGALLIGNDVDLWIEGLDSWPAGYYKGGDKGKRVRVIGILAEDKGLPVFIQKDEEPIKAGIPVAEGTDVEAASRRYIVRQAKWELIPDSF